MIWLRRILLVSCVGLMWEPQPAAASHHPLQALEADDPVDRPPKSAAADVRSKASRTASVPPPALAGPATSSRQRDADLLAPSRRGEGQTPDVQAGAILPGLPSPMVAVVDPADAALLARPPSRRQAAVPEATVDPVGSGSRLVGSVSGPITTGGPVSIAASIAPPGQEAAGGLLLPFDRRVGAAAFRRANLLVVVFDSSKPVDLSPVTSDPIFGAASYSLLSSGAMMTLPVPADTSFELLRKPDGWLIEVAAGPPTAPIRPDPGADGMTLPVANPGQIVVVSDPILKIDLLVGTVRQDRQNMQASWHGPSYILYQTVLGAVVERLADRLEMRATSNSFLIEQQHGQGALPTDAAPGDRTFFSRLLDLPSVDDAELQRRYKAALAKAATAPLADRRLPRLAAAEAALGLGQGREAGRLAAVADQDAPAGPAAGRSVFLQAAAAVLDRAPGAFALLEDPRIANNDEVMLWRALDLAQREGGNADAARTILRCLPLIDGYPARLRDRLLGDAAMSLAEAGGPRGAERVLRLDAKGNGKVKLAQATVLLRESDPRRALAVLDPLAADPDPAVAFAAAGKAIELRLQRGQIKPSQAADRLDAETFDARMAGDELALKLRVAALRAQVSDWPAALGLLREVATSFPTASQQAGRASADILLRMAGGPTSAASPPDITQLSLIENNLDLLQADADRTKVSIALAGRLAALDLPERAARLLADTVVRMSPGVERARLGLELAQLRLDQADAAGVLAALDATVVPDLPATLSDARALMRARADAAAGQTDAALATLAPLQGQDADTLRASELAVKQDWRGETAVLASLVAHEVPATGKLSAASEDLVLRLVAATAHSGDGDALRQLGPRWKTRFSNPAKLDMLRLLTSDSVKSEADLARAASELSVSHDALSALSSTPASDGG